MAFLTALNGMAFTFCAFRALDYINLSLFSLFSMLGGMVLPFFQGILFYDEEFTLAKGVCVVFIIAALLCTLEKGEKKKGTVFYAGIFVLNGMSGVISKIFTTSTLPKASAAGYSIWSAAVTIFLSAIAWLVLSQTEKRRALAAGVEREKLGWKVKWQSYGIGALSGAINKVANFLLVLALVHVDASVQYPMVTGGTMIVSTVLSFFGDKKPNKREILGVFLAFLGIERYPETGISPAQAILTSRREYFSGFCSLDFLTTSAGIGLLSSTLTGTAASSFLTSFQNWSKSAGSSCEWRSFSGSTIAPTPPVCEART
jgi:drug/metabolite transporter (DMT)-like permease